jgi:alpha-ketoglutarate-dependent taurine dioxygenase
VRQVTFTSGSQADRLTEWLASDGSLCIRGIEGEKDLLVLAESMGEIVEPGVGMPSGMHDGRVYSVAIRGDGSGELDKHGHPILSTTDREFPLHTDAYNRSEAPRYVFLFRVDRAETDTASYVSDFRKAADLLGEENLVLLQEPVFPSAAGWRPVLEERGGSLRFRFNGEEIRRWSQREDGGLSAAAERAVDSLESALVTMQEMFRLEPLDCLLLDNWRVCHGRSRIPAGSKRELKRVWVAG